MLHRARVRETAVALIRAALVTAGATVPALLNDDIDEQVSSIVDNPNWSGHGPFISIKTEDRKSSTTAGTAPQYRTDITTTVSIRAEGESADTAQIITDTLCEMVENTLLGGQGWSLVITLTKGSKTATPASVSGLVAGMAVSGSGLGQDNYIDAIDAASGTVTLYKSATSSGTIAGHAGSFLDLFQQIDSCTTFSDYDGENQAYHTWSADIEIVGHISEVFEPDATIDLTTVALALSLSDTDTDPVSAVLTY